MSSRRPGHLLQVAKARRDFIDYLRRWEYELISKAKHGHLENVGMACTLLLEKMVRIQGHETQETREYEIRLEGLRIRSERLWQAEVKPPVRARPRLSVIPGGVT